MNKTKGRPVKPKPRPWLSVSRVGYINLHDLAECFDQEFAGHVKDCAEYSAKGGIREGEMTCNMEDLTDRLESNKSIDQDYVKKFTDRLVWLNATGDLIIYEQS